MNETEAAAAVAEQEDYLKRVRSCGGQLGMPHSWDTFSAGPGRSKYRACWRCRATETRADYRAKTLAPSALGE